MQRQVAPAGPPAERLDGHPQALAEPDRVRQVPAVHAEPLLGHVQPVGPDHLRQAEVRRGVRGVALTGHVEVPRAAEVVLGAGAADGGELVVGVQVELDLALAPPAVGVHAPRQVRPDVLAGALDAVEQRVRHLVRQGVGAPPLGVEVALGGVVAADLVGDLVVHPHLDVGGVLQRQAGTRAEGHRPVRVEPAVRVRGDHL